MTNCKGGEAVCEAQAKKGERMPAAFMAKSAGLKAVAAAASAVSRASDVRAQWRRVLRYTKKVGAPAARVRCE